MFDRYRDLIERLSVDLGNPLDNLNAPAEELEALLVERAADNVDKIDMAIVSLNRYGIHEWENNRLDEWESVQKTIKRFMLLFGVEVTQPGLFPIYYWKNQRHHFVSTVLREVFEV